MPRSVCIVSPGNFGSNPRLVKEADALHESGYDVTAIACDYSPAWRPFDDAIVARSSWKALRVPRPRREKILNRTAPPFARAIAKAGFAVPLSIAVGACGGPSAALRRAACGRRADLYIAHYVAAIPAAAAAARRHGAMLAFDAEDFHSGEGGDGPEARFRMKMIETVEAAYLPSCAYVTAASPMIGEAYAARYGVAPAPVLNVFPLAMAPAMPEQGNKALDGLRVYWFSQTIGLDRGLQEFIAGMARAKARVALDIRGSDRWGNGDRLMTLARQLGVADHIRILPTASPDDMVRLAAHYDLGLSLETDATLNRRICLTNKIFTYLLAGVPVMMSDTPAQAALAPDLGAAAALVSLRDADGIARDLDRLALSNETLAAAKATAWRLGRDRYNWDIEKQALLDRVGSAFQRGSGGGAWPR